VAAVEGAVSWRVRKYWRCTLNWFGGYQFAYVQRCRVCGHTAYDPDEHPYHGGQRVD